MTSSIRIQQFQQIRHVDEVVAVDENSWWVYRRSFEANGFLNTTPRVVFFGTSREETESWLAKQ